MAFGASLRARLLESLEGNRMPPAPLGAGFAELDYEAFPRRLSPTGGRRGHVVGRLPPAQERGVVHLAQPCAELFQVDLYVSRGRGHDSESNARYSREFRRDAFTLPARAPVVRALPGVRRRGIREWSLLQLILSRHVFAAE